MEKGLIPHEPNKSILLQKVANKEMPPGKKKLPAEDVALIRKWIAQGARTEREETGHAADRFRDYRR